MKILVINSGSSSLKFQVLDMPKGIRLVKGIVEAIGLRNCAIKLEFGRKKVVKKLRLKNHNQAIKTALNSLLEYKIIKDLHEIKAIGHRVVHGGEYYRKPTLIDAKLIKRIRELFDLAPLHNPPNLAGIMACKKALPKVKQVAVFDTAFHGTIPKHAFLYAIPHEYYKRFKIRKYGFHGTSHRYVSGMAAKLLKKPRPNLVTCHLGNGSSITAVQNGKSIDTSMGFTPLQGVIMGTRSGSIDPEIVAYLSRKLRKSPEDIVKILNKQSGLKGICSYSDIRTIHQKALKGNKRCKLALDMLAYNLAMYIASYMAVLKKVDAIVFTAGIGEGAYFVRSRICKELDNLGVKIDVKKNRQNKKIISVQGSKIKVLVIPTNEELQIAKETMQVIR